MIKKNQRKPSEIDLYETSYTSSDSESWLDEEYSAPAVSKFGSKRQRDEDLDDEDDSFDSDEDGPLDLVDGLKGDTGFDADFDEDDLETFDIDDASNHYGSQKTSKYDEDDDFDEDNYDDEEDEEEDYDDEDDDYHRSISFDEDDEEDEEDEEDEDNAFDVDDDEFVNKYTRKGRRGSGGDDW